MPNSARAAVIPPKRNPNPDIAPSAAPKTYRIPVSATIAVKSYNLLIEHQCPQCGAPATLEETDHLFTCAYCRVKSYLLSKIYHYMLPHSAPDDKELVFFPYWRFKGMLFSCVSDGIRDRIVDISHQAIQTPYFPISVGLRSQTLKLRFVSPDTEGRFLRPTLRFESTLGIIKERFNDALPNPVFLQSFVGESLNLLYAPFYVDSRVYDAVLNRPVSPELPAEVDISSLPGGRADWQPKFIPAQCPECGWDLQGARDSLALYCRNCRTLWQSQKEKFIKLKHAHLPPRGESATFLPFWRLKTEISGLDLDSYADLVRVANIPKVIQEPWEEQPFHFWCPAFKIRPIDFLRFSKYLTLSQPRGNFSPHLPETDPYPVTLSIMEAVQSLKLNLASFVKPRQKLLPALGGIEVKSRRFSLIYLPFTERGNELSLPEFRLRINRNLLTYAKHL
jgi:hypothetical protein